MVYKYHINDIMMHPAYEFLYKDCILRFAMLTDVAAL